MGNRAKLEGSMAKIYALEEALGFCIELFGGLYNHKMSGVEWLVKKTLPCLMKCLKVVGIHEF